MPLLASKKISPIGLDIGTRMIKAAQLELSGDRSRIIALAQHLLPVNLELPEARSEAIRHGLNDLLRRGGFRGKNVVLCLNAQQLFVQNVRLPRLPDEELVKVVRWEAAERLPEGFGEAEVRHLVAGDIRNSASSGEGAEIRREVILLACRRKELHELIGLLDSLRLRPLAFDVPACAMVRTTQNLLRRKADEQSVFLFIDMGAGMTTAVITRGHDILLIKPLPIGGQTMDRLVARRLKLSLEDASMARQQWASDDQSVFDPELARAVAEAVRGDIESLASELLMCIRYHGVTFRGDRITKAMIFGGEGNPRLAEQLAGRIDMPCELGDPFAGFEISSSLAAQIKSSRPGQWAVALGLCSRSEQSKAG